MIEKMLPEVLGLSILIMAMVAWIKSLGVKGNALTISAFAFGLALGITYRFAQAPLVGFGDWFGAVIFGLLCGLVATGSYKGFESASGGLWIKAVTDITHEVDDSRDTPQI